MVAVWYVHAWEFFGVFPLELCELLFHAFSDKQEVPLVMHLSMLCPTSPHQRGVGIRVGI